MTQEELIKSILAVPAETQTIEFKRLRNERIVSRIIETIVAMTNTDGGIIVLGVNDKVVLEKTGLARKNNEGRLLPTRAAVLLFAEFPNDLMETKCAVRVFQYTGTYVRGTKYRLPGVEEISKK